MRSFCAALFLNLLLGHVYCAGRTRVSSLSGRETQEIQKLLAYGSLVYVKYQIMAQEKNLGIMTLLP